MELRRPSRLWPASLVVVAGVLLSACSTGGASTASTTTQPVVPGGYQLVKNGTVTIGVRSLPSNFNPNTLVGDNRVTQMVMQQVWPQAFVTTSTFDVETSGLLQSAEVHSVSPLVVVYVINPKAVWSDGTPITAADFIYAWHEHLDNSGSLPDSGLVAGYREISTIVGSDNGRTVTVTFKQPFLQWQQLFANLPPAHVAEQYGWSRAFAGFSPTKVLSGGPFEITSDKPGVELTLSRNPSYWGTPATVGRIRFIVEHSESAVVAGLESGSLSLAEVAATTPDPGVLGSGAVGVSGANKEPKTAGERSSLTWTGAMSDTIWQLCFNFDDPLTNNISVRRGIEHGLDRSEIVADSEDLVDPRVRVALSRLTLSGETSGAGTSAAATAPDLYRPAAALAAFREAGYWPGTDGLMRAAGTGPQLVIDLLEPSGDWPVDQAGLEIQAELQALGLRVSIEQRSLPEILGTLLPQGTYEMALVPFLVEPAEAAVLPEYSSPVLPAHLTTGPSSGPSVPGTPTTSASSSGALWTTKQNPGEEPGALAVGAVTRDVSGFDDDSVDNYFAQALSQLDPPVALSYLAKAEQILWQDVVTVPLFQPGFDLVHSVQLENVSESPTAAGPMWDAEHWAILKHVPKASTTTTSLGS